MHSIKPVRGPTHASTLRTGTHDRFTGSFSNSTADLHSLETKRWIAHACGIGDEIAHFNLWHTAHRSWLGRDSGQRCNLGHEVFNAAFTQEITCLLSPRRLLWTSSLKNGMSDLPHMFACVPEINNLHRLGKVFCNQAPDPDRSIS